MAWLGLGVLGWTSDRRPVERISAEQARAEGLHSFYAKRVRVHGFPIVGSERVSDAALLEAAWILERVTAHRREMLGVMATNKVKLAVMAWNEFTTDVPEHAHLKPRVYWNRRARGLGATPAVPTVSCAEENLLAFPGDPYSTENILIHEFAHALHETAMNVLDPTFDTRLKAAYEEARQRGLWKGTYADSNRNEYWAEGVQSWFDDNRENDALHHHVNTRVELKAHDPALAALCAEVLGDRDWRYVRPARRPALERAHLADVDFERAPRFQWKAEPVPARPRVEIHTEMGTVELELDRERAPGTVTNFLRYVEAGHYQNGRWFRAVRTDHQQGNPVKIQVLQAAMNPEKENEAFPPIPLERTRDTGLKHLDGVISMARTGPDSAQHHFFVCIGDQPELDFGGRRNPDGQGFAAFGRVVRGMQVIHAIHAMPGDGERLKSPVKIQRAIRLE